MSLPAKYQKKTSRENDKTESGDWDLATPAFFFRDVNQFATRSVNGTFKDDNTQNDDSAREIPKENFKTK